MPDARLQRTREAYSELNKDPFSDLARLHRFYGDQWCRVCGSHKSAHAPECGQKANTAPAAHVHRFEISTTYGGNWCACGEQWVPREAVVDLTTAPLVWEP